MKANRVASREQGFFLVNIFTTIIMLVVMVSILQGLVLNMQAEVNMERNLTAQFIAKEQMDALCFAGVPPWGEKLLLANNCQYQIINSKKLSGASGAWLYQVEVSWEDKEKKSVVLKRCWYEEN